MDTPQNGNQNLGFKIGYATVILIFVVFGGFVLYEMQKIADLNRTIHDHPLMVSNAANQANTSVIKMHRNMKDVVLFKSASRVRESIQAVDVEEKEVYRQLDTVKDLILGEEGKALEKEARQLFDDWRKIRTEVIDLVNENQSSNAAEITIGKGAKHVALLEKKMNGLTNYARKKASAFKEEALRVESKVKAISVFFLIAGTLTSLLIALMTLKRNASHNKTLRDSEQRFRMLVENAPEAIFVRDKECFTYLNNAALKLFGASSADELIGTPIIERYHPEDQGKIRGRMTILNEERKDVPMTQSVCLQLDGNEVIVESLAVPITYLGEDGALTYLRNITDRIEESRQRQHLEEQLHQSQKIESIGRLAGGVAHDYNNMLSVIIGNVELAKRYAERSAPVDENLDQILEAANRSKDITRQLLAFARKQIIKPKVINLNDAVESMLKMLRNLLGENIDLRWQPKGNVWPVKIDPSQLDQVLANLCINARDAITDIGKMTIESDTVHLDEDYCKDHQGFQIGNYVVLSVSDNGCGMDKETLDNIFEPFYTTKKTGEGTGLGMAMVYGIVKQSGGFINAYSEPNQGTIFKIYIPRYEGEEDISQERITSKVEKGQGETVLLVEDEAAIVKLTKAMLEGLGYKVLATNSPVDALNLLREYEGDIQLLLTDVVMPEMNGRELTKQLQEICPEIKTLYMSGYTANVIAHHGVLDDGINFIQKPFSRKDLSMRVREILDSNGQT